MIQISRPTALAKIPYVGLDVTLAMYVVPTILRISYPTAAKIAPRSTVR